MTCALTALLISPISWDHHWVWLAPGLALLVDAGTGPAAAAAGRACYVLAVATWAVFAAWPDFWSAQAGLLQGGLIGYAPATAWAYGDNPAYAEYHWHGCSSWRATWNCSPALPCSPSPWLPPAALPAITRRRDDPPAVTAPASVPLARRRTRGRRP